MAGAGEKKRVFPHDDAIGSMDPVGSAKPICHRIERKRQMFIAKRHPLMTSALRAEKGVIGTYALVVVAVVGSLASAAFFWGGLGVDDDAMAAFVAGEPAPWMEVVAPQRAAGTEQSAAPAVAPAEDDEAPPADRNNAGEPRESAEMEAVTIDTR